eukprot:TRINITY_DN23626_c0_g1_i1.p1 TRINITY_DN23626_c0_g1~~TRINITY_DN23626_c0_g1_i1.p1  ORF type:complete len:229 (+),score=40.79 TRINITY_DN23626_c0_g1_i1:39-725(+)
MPKRDRDEAGDGGPEHKRERKEKSSKEKSSKEKSSSKDKSKRDESPRREEKPSKSDRHRSSTKDSKRDKHDTTPAVASPIADETAAAASPDTAPRGPIIEIPIARPILAAGSSTERKMLKLVQSCSREKAVFKGIKDVTKVIRKGKGKKGICILAADVSPMDVISHLPVHCERNSVPYVWVPSKEDLGLAVLSARATSAVLLEAQPGQKTLADGIAKAVEKIAELPKA